MGIGLRQVLVITESRSDSYHIFKAPAAPEPKATAIRDIVASKKQYPTDNYFLNRKKDKLTTYRYSKYMRYNRWQAELIERS